MKMVPISPNVSARMQEKRRKILECALELFAEQGYDNTPVKDIIDKSGFGTGTFYKYFNNREDVLQTLLSEFLDQIIDCVNEYFAREKDLYLRFVGAKLVILEVFIQNQKMAGIYSRVTGISSESIRECIKEFEERFIQFTSKNIQFGIKQGVFREVPAVPLAHSVLAVIKHMIFKWTVLKDISTEEMLNMTTIILEIMAVSLVVKNNPREP